MSSFNDIDGVPVHANKRYLREILKDEWGFDGAIVSDWDGVGEIVQHRVAADAADAPGRGSRPASTWTWFRVLPRAPGAAGVPGWSRGPRSTTPCAGCYAEVPLRAVRAPVHRRGPEAQVAGSEEHRAAARSAAAASLVLLKNDGILPLAAAARTSASCSPGRCSTRPTPCSGRGRWTVAPRRSSRSPTGSRRFTGPGARSVPWTHSDQVLPRHARSTRSSRSSASIPCAAVRRTRSRRSTCRSASWRPCRRSRPVGVRLVVVVLGGRALALEWVAEHADAVAVRLAPRLGGRQRDR